MLDKVTLVNTDNAVIGTMDKVAAHRYPPQLHRAVSVWLVNDQKEVLFQQRSQKKIIGAGWWGNTVCGNVWPNETNVECAQRRLSVELGLPPQHIREAYAFQYRAYVNEQYGENELDQVYVGKISGRVAANPEEVSDYAWISLVELEAETEKIGHYIPAEESLLIDTQQLQGKTPPLHMTLAGQTLLIVPWTVMMLRDQRLWHSLRDF